MPILLVLGIFAPTTRISSVAALGVAVGQALLVVAAIAALGRLVLRPLFRSVARTRSAELFVAACLLVVIVVGLATAAAGLSMALGALIGGLLLAGTEYRRQVEVTIEPFKGLARRVPDLYRNEFGHSHRSRRAVARLGRRRLYGALETAGCRRASAGLRPQLGA